MELKQGNQTIDIMEKLDGNYKALMEWLANVL